MKRFIILQFSFLIALVCLGSACQKQGIQTEAPVSVEDQQGDDLSEKATNSSEPPAKIYYSDVQVLTQTTVEGACSDDKKVIDDYEEKPKVILTDEKKLDLLLGENSFRLFSVNVNFQMMGFDRARYSFTALDGVVPKKVPLQMRFRRTPGNVLELSYLDQKIRMILQTTPVYTFSAEENRDGCKIIHQVNIFGERTGYYPVLQP